MTVRITHIGGQTALIEVGEQVPGGPALAHLDVDQDSFAWLDEEATLSR